MSQPSPQLSQEDKYKAVRSIVVEAVPHDGDDDLVAFYRACIAKVDELISGGSIPFELSQSEITAVKKPWQDRIDLQSAAIKQATGNARQ